MRLGTNGGFGVRRRQKHCFKDIFALTAIHDKGLKIHCAVPDPPPSRWRLISGRLFRICRFGSV